MSKLYRGKQNEKTNQNEISHLEAFSRYVAAFDKLRQTTVTDWLTCLLIVTSIIHFEHNVLEAELQRMFVRIFQTVFALDERFIHFERVCGGCYDFLFGR